MERSDFTSTMFTFAACNDELFSPPMPVTSDAMGVTMEPATLTSSSSTWPYNERLVDT